ncbi:MAG: methionine--tRNA ligase [Candidatus Woesearchaeota archaeon]
MKEKFYITTAIDYVNSPHPHQGHAYEKICADVLARWHRLLGREVFFLTGTDENAQKNSKAAKEAKIPVRDFVDQNAAQFKKLCKKLNISNDRFIRTTEEEHIKASQEIFKKVYDKGDIYKGTYDGYYCNGCEAFLTEKDLVNGKCPEHKTKPDWLKEESYFFKMEKYKDELLKLLESKSFVLPEHYRNEVLKRVKEEGLKDLSVSRVNLDWGIPVPFDKKHKIYVWFDALINYLSGIGYPKKDYEKLWPADIHLIGKGINWFHSVIFQIMLISAGIKNSKTILVHGYINLEGKKMSKSQGKFIDPFEICEKYGTDPLRYFLIREIPFGEDGEFSEDALKRRLNNELANDLGNLLSRTLSMVEKYFNGRIPKGKNELSFNVNKIKKFIDEYELHTALSEIWKYVKEINKYLNEKKPWENEKERDTILYTALDSLRIVSILLYPFIPGSIDKINRSLGIKLGTLNDCKPDLLESGKIKIPEPLFKKIEED